MPTGQEWRSSCRMTPRSSLQYFQVVKALLPSCWRHDQGQDPRENQHFGGTQIWKVQGLPAARPKRDGQSEDTLSMFQLLIASLNLALTGLKATKVSKGHNPNLFEQTSACSNAERASLPPPSDKLRVQYIAEYSERCRAEKRLNKHLERTRKGLRCIPGRAKLPRPQARRHKGAL